MDSGPVRLWGHDPVSYTHLESRFRFSCEYMDDELGLVYYNYRHLNPTDGRWINRDPIQEQGGWNLYAFIRNRINIEVDLLGKIPPYNGGASGIVEVPIFPPAPTPPAPTPPAPTPPQEGCSIQICCRPVAVFSRAHCVIRFVSVSYTHLWRAACRWCCSATKTFRT